MLEKIYKNVKEAQKDENRRSNTLNKKSEMNLFKFRL